jgi:hypothetical protein
MEDLLRTIRRQVLTSVIRPYTRISLHELAVVELNGISVEEVEHLLIRLILDGTLQGEIDQVEGIFYKTEPVVDEGSDGLQDLVAALETLSTTVTSVKFKDGKSQGMMSVH